MKDEPEIFISTTGYSIKWSEDGDEVGTSREDAKVILLYQINKKLETLCADTKKIQSLLFAL